MNSPSGRLSTQRQWPASRYSTASNNNPDISADLQEGVSVRWADERLLEDDVEPLAQPQRILWRPEANSIVLPVELDLDQLDPDRQGLLALVPDLAAADPLDDHRGPRFRR